MPIFNKPQYHIFLILGISFCLGLSACGWGEVDDGIPNDTLEEKANYIATRSIPATAPAPIDSQFRDDSGNQVFTNPQARPMLVWVFMEYCGNCLAMRPQIHALEAEYWRRINFVYLNRDKFENYEAIYGLNLGFEAQFSLLSPDLEIIQQWKGFPSIETLRGALDAYLESSDSTHVH